MNRVKISTSIRKPGGKTKILISQSANRFITSSCEKPRSYPTFNILNVIHLHDYYCYRYRRWSSKNKNVRIILQQMTHPGCRRSTTPCRCSTAGSPSRCCPGCSPRGPSYPHNPRRRTPPRTRYFARSPSSCPCTSPHQSGSPAQQC